MEKENIKIEKLCGFYVSEWHLATMLLPYVSHKIDDKSKIITILENDIEENIKILLKKLNIKNEKAIKEIGWKNINSSKYSEIEKILNKEIKKKDENIVLINGGKKNIHRNNENVKKWLDKHQINKIKIINLFEVTDFNYNIKEILDAHDKILNTSGEKEIGEVFEGYKKENKKEVC